MFTRHPSRPAGLASTIAAAVLAAVPLAGTAGAQRADAEDREKITAPEVPDDSGKRPDLAKAAALITESTNALRKKEGRGAVAENRELAAAARYFADYMAKNDEYGHAADGKRPAGRAEEHGYEYCVVLENIANAFDSRGFETERLADKFFTGWKESPGHRKNMLDPDVTDTGAAVARSEKTGYYYAVQLFGRPKSAAIEFRVENRSGEALGYTVGGETFELPARVVRTHTRCRPAEVAFRRPGAEKPDATVTPTGGERFVVTREGETLSVKTEPPRK